MYEDFYGLSGKPFQLSPDPAFYFGSKGHESAFSYLKYGVYQGEGFLVITGEIGAGKTTLVRALLEELDPQMIVAAQIVSTQLEADDLLRSVAKAFGIRVPHDDKANLIAAIEAFLLTVFQQEKRALLIVDEAQNLNARSIEELRMLSNFQYGDRALLQSFLVGQPELRTLMRSASMEQFRQRVIASYHLGPLDEAETRGYIEHRLHRVGWKDVPEFDESAVREIFVASGGIPRRINAICNRLMLAGFLAGQRKFTEAEVVHVVNEFTGEIGPRAIATPLPEPTPAKRVTKAELATSVRRLLKLSDRIENLERDVAELLGLVRVLVEPERALPSEEGPRRKRPKRRRNTLTGTSS
jgi:putative secretion ATPase (PEP-CTERM system associated)